MKKTIAIISTILLFGGILNGQNNTDSTAFSTGFEPAYHNVAILQTSKGRYYYKNTNAIFNTFGKNFANRFEVELGVLPNPLFPLFEMANFKARYVYPISEKLNFGCGYNIGEIGTLLIYMYFTFYYKQEVFTGITYKNNRSLHSFNLHFGQIQGAFYEYNIKNMWAFSSSYVYMNNFSRYWSVISDNKFYVIRVDYDFPKEYGNYGDFNLYVLENVMAFRYHAKRHNLDFGVWYLLGMKEWEFKFNPAPYISYSLNFLKKSER